ncbi:MAG: FtsX-like permease family protein, partial [Bacillota bacterium]
PASAPEVRPMSLVEGRFLGVGDGNAILISHNLAGKTGLGLGDTLDLPSASGATRFEIVGVVAGRPTVGAEEVYMPLSAAQELFNLPGRINTIEALFASGSDAAAVRQAVLDRLGSGYRLGGNQAGSEILAIIEMGDFIFNMFGVMSLAMGGFIIFITFRTVVAERRRDIGMLRAVGASRRTILSLILTESLLQGVAGTAIGLVAGYFLVVGLLAAMAPIWEKQVHFSLGSPSFTPQTYLIATVLGVGVTLLGGLYPAISACRVPPLEALRPSMGEVTWKAASRRVAWGAGLIALALAGLVSGNIGLASLGAILFLVGLLVIGPAQVQPVSQVFGRLLALAFAGEGQIAQGNVVRQPGRAATTASAMTIGLAILVGVVGMTTSMYSASWEYVKRGMRSDYLLMPQSRVLGGGNVGAGPELVQALRDTPGIGAVTSLRMSTARAGEVDLQVVGIDPVAYPQLSGLEFSAGDPRKAFAELSAGRSMIVNGIFAARNGLTVGQEVTLQTPGGPQVYRVAGVGTDFLNMKLPTSYISHANLQRDFHETSDLLIMVNQARDASPAKVRAALQERVRDYPSFSLFSTAEWLRSQKADFNAKMAIVFLLVAILAVPSLIALLNTLVISVLERTREIGMLRAVGATRRQVQRMILAESLLLAAAGTAFGILAGIWLGYVLVGAMRTGGFTYPYYFPYMGILLTIAVGLLFGVLGALVPARQAARLNIVSALQYE